MGKIRCYITEWEKSDVKGCLLAFLVALNCKNIVKRILLSQLLVLIFIIFLHFFILKTVGRSKS